MSSRILQNLFEGFSDNFYVLSDAQYRRPERGGFQKDIKALKSDIARVAAIAREKTNEAYVKRDASTSE